jgi:hypothetical protein
MISGKWRGPAEGQPWPDRLTARVITPGPRPHVHGYDVEDDVARHFRFGESVLLALTGIAPDEETGRRFEIALTFASALAVTEAPTHAAVIARTCAGSTSAVIGTAAVALAEHARWLVDRHAPLLAWLEAGAEGEVPAIARATDDDDRASVARLRDLLGKQASCVAPDLSRDAALLSLLHSCGSRTAEQIEAALVVSRLSTTMAEALAATRGGLRDYPLNVPPFVYEEEGP